MLFDDAVSAVGSDRPGRDHPVGEVTVDPPLNQVLQKFPIVDFNDLVAPPRVGKKGSNLGTRIGDSWVDTEAEFLLLDPIDERRDGAGG